MLGVVLLSTVGACTRAPPPLASAGPGIVLATIDTLRADRATPALMPVLARLGREGAVFEQAVSVSPITEVSHLAMFTGIPPHVSGVVANGTTLGDRPALIWRVLHDRGWRTAGFVSGYPLQAGFGWGQGMDVYDADFGMGARERRGDHTVDRALAWIAAAEPPFFLWVHLYDPHSSRRRFKALQTSEPARESQDW